MHFVVVIFYLQSCFALKLSRVHGTKKGSKIQSADLVDEVNLLRSTFLHLHNDGKDTFVLNDDNCNDKIDSDCLNPLNSLLKIWKTTDTQFHDFSGKFISNKCTSSLTCKRRRLQNKSLMIVCHPPLL